ncbi:hypothetical protein PL9214520318 [Planktothrix tepida PCC 9214]|uniref:Uncharacterized protein n=1 Tax=Planktothrix tepida PCC 9214 TaxID=671072 RepID=A0A1J1LMR8_9CYAN|nr:hypothetical protein PL9214520318 [Planktothrix tepida PCC 9214]
MSATILSSTVLKGFYQGLGKGKTLMLLEFVRISDGLWVDEEVDTWKIGKFDFTFL